MVQRASHAQKKTNLSVTELPASLCLTPPPSMRDWHHRRFRYEKDSNQRLAGALVKGSRPGQLGLPHGDSGGAGRSGPRCLEGMGSRATTALQCPCGIFLDFKAVHIP